MVLKLVIQLWGRMHISRLVSRAQWWNLERIDLLYEPAYWFLLCQPQQNSQAWTVTKLVPSIPHQTASLEMLKKSDFILPKHKLIPQ